MTKYNTTDNYNYIQPDDDIATITYGNVFFIPATAEFNELMQHTQHEYVENYKNSGVNGYTFTGNGNTIFIPCAGYYSDGGLSTNTAALWTSSINTSTRYRAISFFNEELYSEARSYGMPLRIATDQSESNYDDDPSR